MAAPTYKLTYFAIRYRAEPIRWILSYAGQEFEDIRLDFPNWSAIKSDTPFGQLPILEVDGKILGQGTAIARYLARRHGLAGQGAWEEAQVDALVDYVSDALQGYQKWVQEFIAASSPQDTGELARTRALALSNEYTSTTVKPYLYTLERHLEENEDGKGYFVGKKPSWADIAVVTWEDEVVSLDSAALDEYPLLLAHNNRVQELKGIKEWIAKRPTNSI